MLQFSVHRLSHGNFNPDIIVVIAVDHLGSAAIFLFFRRIRHIFENTSLCLWTDFLED